MSKEKSQNNSQKARDIANKARDREFFSMNIDQLLLLARNNNKLICTLNIKISALEKENAQLRKENQVLQEIHNPSIKYKGYNKAWTWTQKIVFILTRNKKQMITSEFEKEILILEPTLEQGLKNTYSSTVQALYDATKKKCVIQYDKIGIGGYSYILPEWLDINGKLKPKFKY